MDHKFQIRGRGASSNPASRFEQIDFVPDPDEKNNRDKPQTSYFNDTTKKLITFNESPDIPFEASINPYRGCEHGCVYCFARPTHEYLGLSAGLDFETKIFVKLDAAELLRKELNSRKWVPQPIAMSGVTDCYQQAEKHFKITRKCLEVFTEFRNPVQIVTKNYLVTRDIDLLTRLAKFNCISVVISVTTLDPGLSLRMEPRASHPSYRLKAIKKLSDAGIPVMLLIAPVIPGLNDHEIPEIIEKSVKAGADQAGYVILRLPYGLKDIFCNWLDTHYPARKNKVIHRIESLREGKLNSSVYHERMKGKGIFSEQIKDIFELSCRRQGISGNKNELDVKHFRRINNQMQLF